ncbi:MAG: aminopeptidase [Rhodospirillaceae bacterium]|nr:aminopeptidase [Rhodospirillaceae bacterium]|tara:strand:+ start:17027 stop:18316 length:1290 start_codon:yes stop_codon:yes gene_type:complete
MDLEEKIINESLVKLKNLRRSLTGKGSRETHHFLSQITDLNTFEVPSGKKVFDWNIPQEWKVNSARLTGPNGNIIIDIDNNFLHLLNYSDSFQGELTLSELKKHLYTLPENPSAIPYVTSYYEKNWGFCISYNEFLKLEEGIYKVDINTEFLSGSMTSSDLTVPGISKKEIFFSSYTCHPVMGNDEICGSIALALLARRLRLRSIEKIKYSIRFLFAPETIGSLAYLHTFGNYLKENMIAGVVVCNIAWPGEFKYKKSKFDSLGNKAMSYLSKKDKNEISINEFSPIGSDERQYCSPGFNLPVGQLSRAETYFKNYHTSLDTFELIDPKSIITTVNLLEDWYDLISINKKYINLKPFGEAHFSKYNLYPKTNFGNEKDLTTRALLWLMNFSDGNNDLVDISSLSKTDIIMLSEIAENCEKEGLIKQLEK